MKIKSIFKRSLAVVLALMMLLTSGIVSAVAANVDLAPTGVDHTGGYVYFLKPSTWTSTYVMMFIGHDSYTSVYQMSKVTNTDNLYRYTMPSWGGATYVAFANASSLWGSGNWGPSNRTNATHYTNVYNNYGFNSGSYYVCVPANSSNNAGISINYKSSASALNLTTRANVYGAAAGSTSYASNAAAGTVSVSGYYMSGYNTAAARSAVSSTASTAYASTTLAPGSSATFTATPATGYEFVGWSTSASEANIVSSSSTYTFKYDTSYTAKTVYALFKQAGYSYTVTAGEGGTITSATSGTAASATVTASPSAGYTFAGWTTTNGTVANASSASTTFTPSANGANAHATFTKITNTVNVTVDPSAGGSAYITYNGANAGTSANVEYGDSIVITASANAGYKFKNWTVNGVTQSGNNPILTLDDITSAQTVVANFEETITYTVTMSASPATGGTAADRGGNSIANVAEGSAITMIATPKAGYHFTGWSVSGSYTNQSGDTSSESFSIIPNANITATANFAPNSGTVTFAAGDNGSVTNAGGTATYPGSVSSTATPVTGYKFVEWEISTTGKLGTDYEIVSGGVNEDSIEIRIITDGTVVTATAKFAIKTFTVNFFAESGGAHIGSDTVEYGKSATAPAEPTKVGHTFAGWDKDFSNVTSDLAVNGTFTANTYTVTVTSPINGGTATASPTTVTYPGTVLLTAIANKDYIFTGWNIDGEYEGTVDLTATTITITPIDNLTVTPNFVEGQYLTVHSYSPSGYDNLYLWEMQGTTEKHPNGEWPGTVQPNNTTFNGVNWDTSKQFELTNGYSTEVGAILNDGGLTVPSGTGNLIMFNNTLGWSNVYLYTSTTDGSLWSSNGNGATTSGKTAVTMTKISGTNYYYAYVSGTIGDTLFVKDKQDGYGNLWETSASCRSDYSSSNPMFTPSTSSNETLNSTVYYSSGSWGAVPSETMQTDDIDLTSTLYNGNTWNGVSEVWIYQNGTKGVVTLRRDLLDLITSMSGEYNGGANDAGYTAASWTAFVSAYEDAYTKSGAQASTQAQIDAAAEALQKAYDELEIQNYFTVTVNQSQAGTVEIGSDKVTVTEGSVNVTEGKTVDVKVTAPTGYYIKSISGAFTATDEASPYTKTLTVTADCEINVTYAPNPTVTVALNDGGTVTINGSEAPVVVDYKGEAAIYVKAPNGKFVSDIMVNGTSVYQGNERSDTAEYTLTNVTANQAIVVTYGTRTAYTITVDAYDGANGKLYYDSEFTQEIPADGDTVTVYTGDNLAVYAKPNDSYAVESWVVDGAIKPAATTYQFTNISANHTVTVKWVELQMVDVTIKAYPNSVATVTATSGSNTATNKGTNSFTILEGEQVTLTAGVISDTRFVFNGWAIKGDYDVVSGGRGSETFVIIANEDLEVTANYIQVYRRIYLQNDKGWSQPYIHVWTASGDVTTWPGDKMKYDSTLKYWYYDAPTDITGIQFNDGTNQDQVEFKDEADVSKNLFNNSSKTANSYVEAGYYLQGNWNGKKYSGYDQVKFVEDTNGNYLVTITVTSTTDGYIYVNPTDHDSNFWNAATANATGNPQTLVELGAYTATPNQVKVEIDTNDFNKAYDVTFTFNPTTGYFAWSKVENIPTISIIGADGRTTDDGTDKADQNIVTDNYRIGDTYFDLDTVLSAQSYKDISEKATAHSGDPVSFYTQVKPNTDGTYSYRVDGWVVNGTEYVHATDLGNGKYMGSYTFTEEENSFVPVYFHTNEWLTANDVKTVTVYAVSDKTITNWDTYISAYTWYKVGGEKKQEQFGRYSGQVMIPVAGLDNVYYTIVEYGTGDKIQISGITFSNYATSTQSAEEGGKTNDVIVNSYSNIQTYDYYEFISLLNDGKENITFVLKNTNDTYNNNRVSGGTVDIKNGNWDFKQFVDYSGLKTDIFGNNIESIDSTLDDANALYVIQAGDQAVTDGTLDGQWYVKCYLYNASGTCIGSCYSYELHDEDSALWSGILAPYENQRAYFSYEAVNGPRYDGEWYGDADVSVQINLAVNVGLMGDNGNYVVDTTGDVNDADYGSAYINVTEQNVNVERGATVTLSAMPKTGYKFVGWYSADGSLFTTNISYTVTAAIGTTYTAVFEELDQGKFYVNHYIYNGIGESEYVPTAHNGNAVLYVGIENVTKQTSTNLLKGNSASLDVTEGDVLYITIATDATGADTFYSWYTDALDKLGLTTFEEVGVDSDDNLYDNKGTVVGRNDIVYFKFRYEFKAGNDRSINLYSDLMPVSVHRTLLYSYTDRYGKPKTVKVAYDLTLEEIEGFAGNNFTPYTPAYISGDGWVNTIQANAPYVDGYYEDIVWVINETMYDTSTFEIWATQPDKQYTITIYSGADPDVRKCGYDQVITLDATELFGGASGKGFWYEDIDGDGLYNEDTDKIITYNAFYGYRVTSDMSIGYEKTDDEMKFDVSLDAPVYSREQETDKTGNLVDKVYVDYMINITTPHLYGQEGWTEDPIYKGETITDNWNGAHVTLESYEKVTGATVEYGVIVQQFGASIDVSDYNAALEQAIGRGYTVTDADDTNLINTLESANGQLVVGQVAYKKYEANNHPTNFNRVLFTVYYNNTTANQGKFFNAYGYIKITHANGEVEYHFSNAQYHNIYETGTTKVPSEA